eukprot:CAMPEP_0118857344 /NCGR_PEP_ID=MMETSP1163-20130328/4489_1 /TAXON_ID=124430 /ORGANISM="Phaeomonas parva, Strain CCMP2877" /LENGTH=557 /DNA_ID=CAMNT_0006790647 /DNA_START=186 /DNA_END=1859 /DNA_ORIENTATION=-
MAPPRLASLALLALGLGPAAAELRRYKDWTFTQPLTVFYHYGGMYSHKDAPAQYPPGDGRSFIKYGRLEFSRKPNDEKCRAYKEPVNGTTAEVNYELQPCYDASRPARVEVAIVEQGHFHRLGKKVGNRIHYCCSEDAVRDGACSHTKLHQLIFDIEGEPTPRIKRSFVDVPAPNASDPASSASSHIWDSDGSIYNVYKTGFYNLFIAACDEGTGDLVINGYTEWMNPWGYLPAADWGKLPFYGSLALIYLFLGLSWCILMVTYVKDLLAIQSWISVVIFLAMVETAAQYFSYNNWNASGLRDSGGLIFALLVGVSKRSLSRVLVLMVSTGYGVVKPSLGSVLYKILVLGGLHFVFALTLSLMEESPKADASLGSSEWVWTTSLYVVTLLCSTIDTTFYMWIVQELSNTIGYLKKRRQEVKLKLFRRFRAVLILSAVFSIAWAITVLSLWPNSNEPWQHWKIKWALDAVWEVCYLVLCIAICFLWRPSVNMQRYAYSVQLGGSEDDDYDDDLDTGVGIEIEEKRRVIDDEDDEEYGGQMEDLLPSANGSGAANAKLS